MWFKLPNKNQLVRFLPLIIWFTLLLGSVIIAQADPTVPPPDPI